MSTPGHVFVKTVHVARRNQMIAFLREHFRYHTMNSWNGLRSYAHRIKLDWLPRPPDVNRDTWYSLYCTASWYWALDNILTAFAVAHEHRWQIGQNGRSGGYFVLYRGGVKDGTPFTTGAGVDMDDDFESWDNDDLRERIRIVRAFDQTCEDAYNEYCQLCRDLVVVEETVGVLEKVLVAIPREELAQSSA